MKGARLAQYVEQLLEAAMGGNPAGEFHDPSIAGVSEELARFDCRNIKVVAFGGGTGLSTVIGGNSQLEEWPDQPFVGLKEEFSSLNIVVCTTDDGGSTGLLLQQLPIIAIGDLRKILLSLISRERLKNLYGLHEEGTHQLVRSLHCIFNHRFPPVCDDFSLLANPLLLLPQSQRDACPQPLLDLLVSLGRSVSPRGRGPTLNPGGHCLGNLLLVAAIYGESPAMGQKPPDFDQIEKGLATLGNVMGVTPGCLHPATCTPGQLVLRYGNGVAVRGQKKSALTRRNFAIDRVSIEFCDHPVVNPALCEAIGEAELIIFAPGSVYTSIMPVLQVPEIAHAIKKNKKALKILGANFWIQEGETDISWRSGNRGFHVSELVEAYERNVPGGAEGLFDVVLSANLEHMPGNVLSNYALEGKSPIYLDRHRVERFHVLPIEATIYSTQRLKQAQVIHHDPGKFATAVRTLVFAHQRFDLKQSPHTSPSPVPCEHNPCNPTPHSLLCAYNGAVDQILSTKHFPWEELRGVLQEAVWENRDIRLEHLEIFRGARIIPAAQWGRSEEWDNVLGYYDPGDGLLKVHERLWAERERLKENLLIALGESLLGRYLESRCKVDWDPLHRWQGGHYEVRLLPVEERECYLGDGDLRAFLRLCRMIPSPLDSRNFRITLNGNEGFIPPGLLFGLLYAWYLNNAYGEVMEYEMSLLRWDPKKLIPCQLEERKRRQALVDFFRNVVFEHSQ